MDKLVCRCFTGVMGMQMGKGYAGQANKARNKAEAVSICEEGFTQVESVYL